ncbi:hypothetical protein BIV24_06870 [Streptomyces colonosanans]|uniref:Cytochrome oxidase subunit I profile domain-containing protein n=1 Tax=Streptomyces colonosanans TaxID=1428652 RepID=A0A1S2PV81_9ACTN|nr:hypothetical protein BIV24_06870 [Streptomyces colonosanans]
MCPWDSRSTGCDRPGRDERRDKRGQRTRRGQPWRPCGGDRGGWSSTGRPLPTTTDHRKVGHLWKTAKYGTEVKVDDPWGFGRSLERATSCPPPRHNFVTLPRIRSESPAFDLHHPLNEWKSAPPVRPGRFGRLRSP